MGTILRYCLYAVLAIAVFAAVRNYFFTDASAGVQVQDSVKQDNVKMSDGDYQMTAENKDASFTEKTKEGAVKAWDKTKEVTSDAAEATKEGAVKAWDKTKEVTSDAAEATKEGAVKAWDKTKEVTSDATEVVKEKIGD